MNSRNNNIVFLVLLFAAHTAFTGKEFDIDPVGQEQTLWCWAASCEMIFNAYQIDNDQYDAANWAVGGNNETNDLSGEDNSVDKVLQHFGSINSNYTFDPPGEGQGNISKYDLSYEIDQGRPIIVQAYINNQYYHDVLIRGYEGPSGSNMTNVIFNDPADGGSRRVLSYAMFVKTGNSWEWYETLRLTTNPRTPIPEGFDDWVRIYDGGTTTITPSTTSLSYTAAFYNVDLPPSHPVSWNWKLIFVHSAGDCVARSWTSTSTNSELTWNISSFSLPSGYQWYYNYDGKIPGRVELDLLDNDGVHHFDAINVMYVPNNLYPGVLIYEDHTVNNSQSEVRVHELLIMRNDQFLSGGNITFRSGERIDIKDGISIQNGSASNFTIDPSIR